MSTFTQFDGEERLVYLTLLSKLNNRDLWGIKPGYRYYIGYKGSDEYVDVEDGFVTDGATIPRFLWSILPPIGEYTQATTLHDKLCTTYTKTKVINGVPVQVSITRKEIDAILKEALLVLEVTPWKIKFIMAGVNIHRFFTRPDKPKPVYDYAL